jgi:chromosome partitioning protein
MIITVGGIKGGCGKTTIATNLAVYLAAKKKEVLLVDADEQETSSYFSSFRAEYLNNVLDYACVKLTGATVNASVLKMKGKYDYIIIDVGGKDTASQRSALLASDIVILPYAPRSFDMWTSIHVIRLIEEIRTVNTKLKAYSFINRADTRGQFNLDAAEMLQNTAEITYVDAMLRNRIAFANAGAQGMGVGELRPRDKAAEAEFSTLIEKILGNDKK